MKLLGRTKNKITMDENSESVLHLGITEVVLVHFNIADNDYQQILESYIHLFPINLLMNY